MAPNKKSQYRMNPEQYHGSCRARPQDRTGLVPRLLDWLPEDLQWDLYLSIRRVRESQRVPEEWLLSRVTLICKMGFTHSALDYRPIKPPAPVPRGTKFGRMLNKAGGGGY